MRRRPWNANLHYDHNLVRLVGPAPARVLEVGSGDGFLSAELARRGHRVTALDLDAGVLARARWRWPGAAVDWQQGDLLTADLPIAGFDAVLSNATLHHLPDTGAALDRLADLVRPGGMLGIVGFAGNSWRDWPAALVAQAVLLVLNTVLRKWEHTAPQHWPPPHDYPAMRRIAADHLPGARFRKLLLGRYLLTWQRPA